MVTAHQLLGFGLVALVLIAIPGPSVVFTVGRALAYGRATALATVLGNSLGLLVVLVLVAFGLGNLVATSDTAFAVLKYGGAAYLVWLGIEAFRKRAPIEVSVEQGARTIPLGRALRQGFAVGFSNPKAYVIFGAVLPQFIDRTGDHETVQMLLLGLLAFVIGICSDSLWALLASQLRHWFGASPRRGRAMGAVGGLSMVGLGVVLAVSGGDS
ncbi:MAG TPA: LysE family translocator [Marmoricola sp.]